MVQTSVIILEPQIRNQTKSTRTDRNAPRNGCNYCITEELRPPKKNEDQPEYNNRGNKNQKQSLGVFEAQEGKQLGRNAREIR